MTPWVNLFHFTHPRWFAARGGFLEPANHADFLRYVERVGRALAPHARHFHVANESMVYVLTGYLMGVDPAVRADSAVGVRDDASRARAARRRLPDPEVAASRSRPSRRSRSISTRAPRIRTTRSSARPPSASTPGITACCSKRSRRAGCALPTREPEEIPHLRGALDLYGFNYYNSTSFGAGGAGSWSDLADPPVDAMHRKVHPGGLEDGTRARRERAARRAAARHRERLPTTDETFRIRYVAAHLAALDRARQRGADVRGYFHWTAVDNYEWQLRLRPGALRPDRLRSRRRSERSVKASGRWFADVIRER